MRKSQLVSRRLHRAAPALANACAGLILAATASAQVNLWTTQDDFSQWGTNGNANWTVSGNTTYDADGSALDGAGNDATAGAAGTPGSLQITAGGSEGAYDFPAFSDGLQNTGTPALNILDPGSTLVTYPPPNFTQVAGNIVPFNGNLQMTYTIPDDNSGGGGDFELGGVLNYDGNFGQFFPSVFSSTTTVDGQPSTTVTIPYSLNANSLSYFQFGIIYNSNFAPTLPIYVDNIGVLATPLEW